MKILILSLIFLFDFQVHAQDKKTSGADLKTYARGVYENLLQKKPVDQKVLNQRISAEIKKLPDTPPQLRSDRGIWGLILASAEVSYLNKKSTQDVEPLIKELNDLVAARKLQVNPQEIDTHVKQVQRYLDQRKDLHVAEIYWEISTKISSLMKETPASIEIWDHLFETQFILGNFPAAQKTLERWMAWAKNPLNVGRVYFRRGDLSFYLGKTNEFKEDAQKFLSLGAKLKTMAKPVRQAQLDFVNKNYLSCASDVNSQASKAGDDQLREKVIFNNILVVCLAYDGKFKQAEKRAIENVEISRATKVQLSARLALLEVYLIEKKNSEAVKTCDDIMKKTLLERPINYLYATAICANFVVSNPNNKELKTDIGKALARVDFLDKKLPHNAALNNFSRAVADGADPRKVAAAREEVLKLFGSSTLFATTLRSL